MAEASKNPGCPACGCPDIARESRIFDHEYALDWTVTYSECQGCGTCYQTPMPSAEALGDAYPPNYHSMGRGGLLVELRYRMRLGRLSRYLHGPGAVLDFGCGDGSFLVYAARHSKTEASRSRQWFGYEISDTRQVEQLEDGRVTLVRGREDDLWDLLPECCLITLNHVIEHLPNPAKTLESLLNSLSIGGVIEGQTPAAGSLEHRVFDRRWSGYHAPRHTVVFSRTGLAEVLKRAGYGDVRVSGAFNPAGIAVSLATLPHSVDAPSKIPRQGLGWMFWLALAAGLGPVDLLSGRPGIVDFAARRSG